MVHLPHRDRRHNLEPKQLETTGNVQAISGCHASLEVSYGDTVIPIHAVSVSERHPPRILSRGLDFGPTTHFVLQYWEMSMKIWAIRKARSSLPQTDYSSHTRTVIHKPD
ncbi:hypothetical protein RvY_05226 [Ramazzottius varieornatus]|uniref:Uncharacterized protein n=1 Tax=Ramazzottius varieornatus TaxID=947166 RepID=A0A1D1UXE3_RAMVA|nr:hypothetical protein RvY_05226 [Ramazzottius varieornatus]